MAKARKLPSGNWNCVVYSHTENGKKKFVSFTAPTKQEVLRQALEFQVNKKNEARPQDITVIQAVEKYINSKSNILSPTTLKEYHNYLKYYAPIANIKIGSISSMDLQSFINELSKNRNPKTVRNIYSLVSSAIRIYCDRNFHVTFPQKQVIERNIPTQEDVTLMIKSANPTLKLAIILASVGGMRRGEVCALKYSDILYDFNSVYIHADMVLGKQGWIYKPYAKNYTSTRRVELPKEVIEMIGTGEPADFILGVQPSTITTDFINLRNRLGFKCKYHDLRHFSASILHAIGVPDQYIQERHGWASDRVMKDVYRNVLADKSSHFTSVANSYFSDNVLGDLRSESERKSERKKFK